MEHSHTDDQPRYWQWPNILGIDAALVAVGWYWLLLPAKTSLPLIPAAVLALSVWLTYLADRLLDVRQKNPHEIISLRHRVTAQYKKILWPLWCLLLGFNLMLALSGLSEAQLIRGFSLLLFTLTYLYAAQKIKSPLCWKELSVGVIFTCGVLLFLEQLPAWMISVLLILLFSCNCLIVAEFDCLRDLQTKPAPRPLHASILITLGSATILAFLFLPMTLCTIIPLLGLYCMRCRLACETLRVMTDAALLIPPSLHFIWALLS